MTTRRKLPAAVTLGRRGGQVSSPAKAAAARLNAKKGGRPFAVQVTRESDGRWRAVAVRVPEAVAYGATKQEAISACRAIARRVKGRV